MKLWRVHVRQKGRQVDYLTPYGLADNMTDACNKALAFAKAQGAKEPFVFGITMVANLDFMPEPLREFLD